MKNFDLNAYGVSEMNVAEMQKVDGGIIGIDDVMLIIAVVSACIYVYNNAGDFVKGFKEGLKD